MTNWDERDATREPGLICWIPTTILLDKRLDQGAKLLMIVILSIVKKTDQGRCFSTNEHLAGMFDVSERSIQNWLKQLKSCGYVRIEELKFSFGNKRCIIPEINKEFKFRKLPGGTKQPSLADENCFIPKKNLKGINKQKVMKNIAEK
jgi:tyrosine-protein phosphatase YwqE